MNDERAGYLAAERDLLPRRGDGDEAPGPPSAFHRRLLEAGAAILGIVLRRDGAPPTGLGQEALLKRLSFMIGQASNGIILTDRAGRMEWVNDGFTRLSGYELPALKGRQPSEVLHGPETDPATVAEMRRAMAAGEAFDVDLRIYNSAGKAYWVNIICTPLRRTEGGIDGFVIIQNDITARKEAESTAQLSAMFYAALAETSQFLHGALDQPVRMAFSTLADRLCQLLGGHVLYIGHLPAGAHWIEMLATAGPGRGFVEGLRLSADPARPEGRGPIGTALRNKAPVVFRIADAQSEDPEIVPYVAYAQHFGVQAAIGGASSTQTGEAVALVVCYRSFQMLSPEAGELFQRITEGLAAFLDRKAHAERLERTERLQSARRRIQQALLAAADEATIYRAITDVLVAETGAAGVEVLVPEGAFLERKAVAGSLMAVLSSLPAPPLDDSGGADQLLPFPTRVWRARRAQVFPNPAAHRKVPAPWREPPLGAMGLVAGWPIALPEDATPLGVMMLVAEQAGALDTEQQSLVTNILENAAIAVQQVRYRQMIERAARLDALTGLFNRTTFLEHLGQALAQSRRTGRLVAIGVLDLDDFKPVNDGWGHAAGDLVLASFGQRLLASMREVDFVARIGGDEFAIVLTDLGGREDLPAILDRLFAAITAPYTLPGDERVRIGASLGITLYGEDDSDPETLLRHADAALYECKAQKGRERPPWRIWSDNGLVARAPMAGSIHSQAVPLYSPEAAVLLTAARQGLRCAASDFVTQFFSGFAEPPEMAALLQLLSPAERDHLRIQHRDHLRTLLAADLTEADHRARAHRVGKVHGLIGLSQGRFLEAMRILERTLRQKIMNLRLARNDRMRLAEVVSGRCMIEAEEQFEGYQSVSIARQQLLTDLSTTLTGKTTWADFLRFQGHKLIALEGITGVALARPDETGSMVYEYTAGIFDAYIAAMKAHHVLPVIFETENALGDGTSGRAWRSEMIETAASYVSDARQAPWRQPAHEVGIRAGAAVPIKDGQGRMVGTLTLMGRYPGMFEAPAARIFLVSLGALLSQAQQRLPQGSRAALLPAEARHTIRASLYQNRLQLHYQPVVSLRAGRIAGFEALARLRLPDGRLILPDAFLDDFGHAELVRLFLEGLHQALAQLAAWEGEGLAVGVSVNLPPTVLAEPECARWVAAALTTHGILPDRLTLEILESEDPHDMAGLDATLRAFADCGIRLALDDLGNGYSSLLRLSKLPLHTVKIDQGLVREASRGKWRVVGVIGSLVRLAQSLALESVIEGLETPEMIEMAAVLGAEAGQGYALARPMPAAEVIGWARGFSLAAAPEAPRSELGRIAREWRFGIAR